MRRQGIGVTGGTPLGFDVGAQGAGGTLPGLDLVNTFLPLHIKVSWVHVIISDLKNTCTAIGPKHGVKKSTVSCPQ